MVKRYDVPQPDTATVATSDPVDDLVKSFAQINIAEMSACHICDVLYKHKGHLVSHLIKCHNVEPDSVVYICGICQKKFKDAKGFKRHTAICKT